MPEGSRASLELMQMHASVLFRHNPQGKLTGLNQWNGGAAPSFYLGRTLMGNVCRFHADVPEALVKELTALSLEETGDILLEPKHKDQYIRLLAAHKDIPKVWQGPAYCCSNAVAPLGPTVCITQENAYLLKGGLEEWIPDVAYWQPFVVSLEDNRAVSVCASVRTIGTSTEAGVETLAAYRRKGHAANAVAAWANTLLEKKVIPLYSTSWDNMASQGIAKKLGFILYGTDFHIT